MTENMFKDRQMTGSQVRQLVGLAVDTGVMFTNHKDVYKKGVEKRQRKLLDKVQFLQPFLKPDEQIFLVTTGCSPMTVGEQFLTGWIIYYLKRSLFVFTNKRIFHIPTKTDYSYRSSLAQILYSDCREIKTRGGMMIVKYKNGKKENFYYIGSQERRKIKSLFQGVVLEGTLSRYGERTHLCPRCGHELVKGEYICPQCRLEFKNKSEARRISIIFPGGGYFYTRHPILGVLDAITEAGLLALFVVALIQSLQGSKEAGALAIYFGVLLGIEKLITVYHSNRFIDEFIPLDEHVTPSFSR